MNLVRLTQELSPQLEHIPVSELTNMKCIRAIREKVSGTATLTNLQIFILAFLSSDKNDFKEKVLIEFIHRTSGESKSGPY